MKCDLGCQVDGYIAVAAHTFIVPTVTVNEGADGIPVSTPNPLPVINGAQADCMIAAYKAAEIAARLIRPGNTNKQVSLPEGIVPCYTTVGQ